VQQLCMFCSRRSALIGVQSLHCIDCLTDAEALPP
jgi:hypothetical protein